MKNLLLVPVLILAAGAAAGEYVVGYGDTLWDISNWFYGTPEKWEDILAANPDLQGVEYLVPGMTLYIPQNSSSSSQSHTTYIPEGAIIIRSSDAILSRLQQESAGFVIYAPLDYNATVIDTNAEDEGVYRRLIALPGDLLELDAGSDQGIMEGHVFHVLRIGEEVRDPATRTVGHVIRVAGVCSVIETTSETSVAMLEHGYLPVEAGDVVVPYRAAGDIAVNNSPDIEPLSVWVLGFRDPDRDCAYTYDVVYLSGGRAQDIDPGDVFTAYAHGEQVRDSSGDWVTTADLPISDLVVLTVEENTCAAMVVANRTANLIDAGDRIYLTGSQIN